MRVGQEQLWESEPGVYYDLYLQDNSVEIEAERLHPAIIICGEGGFLRVSERNKEPVALYFLNQSYQVFVLNYSTKSTGSGRYPRPLLDLAKMVATVREHAAQWYIDPAQVVILGFSSGGTLCASLSAQWQEPFLSRSLGVSAQLFRPDAVVLCYPLVDYLLEKKCSEAEAGDAFSPSIGMRRKDYMEISYDAVLGFHTADTLLREASPYYHVTGQVPPTFIWHTSNDELVDAEQSIRYALRLTEEKVPYELHIFERGAHGMSLARECTAGVPELINQDVAIWPELAQRFLKRHLH